MLIDATYEGGVLKPDRPLPLDEHERVRNFTRIGARGLSKPVKSAIHSQ